MITVHHLNASRSTRVIWLLEEMQLPYEIVRHERDAVTNLAPKSLAKIHPLSKAPIMVENETVICESGAIMEYLLDKDNSNQFRPAKTDPDYYRYVEWLHFAEGSLALPVIGTLMLSMENRSGDQKMDKYIAKEVALDFGYIETVLSSQSYFAGKQFTAADIMMTITLQIANKIGLLTSRTNTLAYLARMQARPAFQSALSFG